MPFNGAGTFSRAFSWIADAAAGKTISQVEMDTDANDVSAALSNCITRDGQSPPSADIPWGGKGIVNLRDPVAAQDAVNLRALQAAALAADDGCCRLYVATGTSLVLSPWSGNGLVIGGVQQAVPGGGIAIANTGLAANTTYYAYAFMQAGVMTLFLGTGVHVTGADGREYASNAGVASTAYRLVGMIRTNASGQFQDDTTFRGCANWFGRHSLVGQASGSNIGTSSAPAVVILPTIGALVWGDEALTLNLAGEVSNNTAGSASYTYFQVDGTNQSQTLFYSSAAGYYGDCGMAFASSLSEGWNTATVAAAVGGGGTSNYSGLQLSIATRA